MKFFKSFILLSSFLSLSLAYPCDVQDIPEPSHQLFFQCSKHHNQLPKNVAPSISFLTLEIHSAKDEMYVPLTSLPTCLHLMRVDTQHAYVYDLCSQHPSIYEHSHYHIFVSVNLDTGAVNLLVKHDNDIWSTKLCDNTNYLRNGNFFDILTYRKFKTFIETKVTAMKLQGFNL